MKPFVSDNPAVPVVPGYYYDLDDSYDESDEEEVRAHLRRVAEQPPLKLDDSTEVKHPATSGLSRFDDRKAHTHSHDQT